MKRFGLRVLGQTLLALSLAWTTASWAQMPQVKISVQSDGMYVIQQADLVNLGVDVSAIQLEKLALFNRDTPIPIFINGGQDGSLDPGDQIIFYGQGIAFDDRLFPLTDTNVYMLREGTVSGARMGTFDLNLNAFFTPPQGGGQTSTPATSFFFSQRLEEDKVYYLGSGFQDGADRWFWSFSIAGGATRAVTFNIDSVDTSGQGQIRVGFQGKTDDPVTPDHHTQLKINNCTLTPTDTWDGIEAHDQYAVIPAGCLQEGNNTLTVTNIGDTGAAIDSVFIDNLEVGYRKLFRAKSNQLLLTRDIAALNPSPTSQTEFAISGFTTDQIELFDITNPVGVTQITGATINSIGTQTTPEYELAFTEPQITTAVNPIYLALGPNQFKTPAGMAVDQPSDLKNTANQADYLLITHSLFKQAVQAIADRRTSQGLKVMVVDVEDIYDEFSGGIMSDQAIKDFISYAYHNWSGTPPAYVLLFGDAGLNFKDQRDGHKTYVPTHFIRAFSGSQAPVDNWFVTVDGTDPLPDLFLGRLPATPANANTLIQKVLSYEEQTDTSWTRDALVIADDDEPSFKATADELTQIITGTYQPTEFVLHDPARNSFGPPPSAQSDHDHIVKEITAGKVVTSYTGHGSGAQWAFEPLLTSNDAEKLANGKKMTFMVSLNCVSGYFVQPWDNASATNNKLSLAEAFLSANTGGAIAVWAASDLGFTPDHAKVGRHLFESINNPTDTHLGVMTTQARIQATADGASQDTLDSFIFFGDPATRLVGATAAQPNAQDIATSGGGGGGAIWAGLLLMLGCGLRKRYYVRIKCSGSNLT